MPIEIPLGLAHPTRREWAEYLKLFEHEPDIRRLLRYLVIRNSLSVKKCPHLFGPCTLRDANAAFRLAHCDVRLIATDETIGKPLLEREVCLYKVEVKNA